MGSLRAQGRCRGLKVVKSRSWGHFLFTCSEHKIGNISETRSYYGGRTDHQRSFERYHPRPHTASASPRLGVRNPNPKLQSLLSQERVKLRTANLADTFTGSIRTKAN